MPRKMSSKGTKDPTLFNLVVREATRHGLKCLSLSGFRYILIGGHHCQIVSSKPYQFGKHTVVPVYLPRPRWADFLIYIVRHEEPSFFIVPREKICRESGVSAEINWLSEYKDAWSPLHALPKPVAESKKPFEELNWKLEYVLGKAESLGYHTERISTGRLDVQDRFLKNRLLINGFKCQLMTAPRMNNRPTDSYWNGIHLYATKEPWADFLIYILKPDEARTTFIIPRANLPRNTTAFITSAWLQKYRENWQSLAKADVTVESHNKC